MRYVMRRQFFIALVFVLLVGFALAYLIQTGERGLGREVESGRTIDVARLDAAESRKLGWKPKGLDKVFAYAATLSTDSLMIVTNGQVVGAFGNLSMPHNVHSIRKAFLSAVVGLHAGTGDNQLPLDATLRELGVDDSPIPLSDRQRSATVNHLLKSTSGINHPAAAEGGLVADKNRRLGNGNNAPGTIWAYNNWDYNALTTLFEKRTGLTIAEAFLNGIAQPVGMKDFKVDAVSYISDPKRSQHKAAMFRMSARDLAIFGQIYLNEGRSRNKQTLPASWIKRITNGYSRTGREGLRWGHGDLWWLPSPQNGLPAGTFWAWGLGNQALFVIPAWNTVIVHQADTTEFLKRFVPMISSGSTGGEAAIEKLILSCREPTNRKTEYCIEHRFITRREFAKLISLVVDARR